jgi:hypothetical protein
MVMAVVGCRQRAEEEEEERRQGGGVLAPYVGEKIYDQSLACQPFNTLVKSPTVLTPVFTYLK